MTNQDSGNPRRQRLRPHRPMRCTSNRLIGGLGAPNPPPIEADPTSAAFFDIDNTVVQGASIYAFGRGMVKNGIVTRRGWPTSRGNRPSS